MDDDHYEDGYDPALLNLAKAVIEDDGCYYADQPAAKELAAGLLAAAKKIEELKEDNFNLGCEISEANNRD